MASTAGRDIFRAVHEHKWLAVEYRNGNGGDTHFWIGIDDIRVKDRVLKGQALHLHTHELRDTMVRIDSIVSSSVVEGSYYRGNSSLVRATDTEEDRFRSIFGTVPNLKVLDYLDACSKLNTTPFARRFSLITKLDEDTFRGNQIRLTDEQFSQVLQLLMGNLKQVKRTGTHMLSFAELALNLMSIRSRKGLYVLAYRNIRVDIQNHCLTIGNNTIFNREFFVGEGEAKERQSVTRFLDADDFYLLNDFATNREHIKDLVAARCSYAELVDDEPYLVQINRRRPVDLREEYDAICDMYEEKSATVPIRAFFGELTKRPVRRREYPLILLDKRINLDQLLAINRAIKYPIAYVQGPPGTGKTMTIVNTILNAFYNKQTVLFASFNNHPVDGVFDSLSSIQVGDHVLDFPVVRLGNREMVENALVRMKEQYLRVRDLKLKDLDGSGISDQDIDRSKGLSELLSCHEEALDLQERRECIQTITASSRNLTFNAELQAKQLHDIDERLAELGQDGAALDEALSLVTDDIDGLLSLLEHRAIAHLKRLGHKQNEDLLDIVMSELPMTDRVNAFNAYIHVPTNAKKFLQIFPIVATTCISAHRFGMPQPLFDMTIIDEASQCDTATSLIPIIRGRSLLLVGDPQQLNPVVVMDEGDNRALRRVFHVPDSYDFIENSVYKCFLACDSVSDEILLATHYRCDERIIEFNNHKYYNGRLKVASKRRLPDALTHIEVPNAASAIKNTSPAEVAAVVHYARTHPDEKIGVITPFANQREFLRQALDAHGLENVSCGTVHAFQGDETDVVLFSPALTERTSPKTYEWLTENRELINVATSRAKDKLIVLSNQQTLDRLHRGKEDCDDFFELVSYVKSHGETKVTPRAVSSRALGIKPYSTQTESAFLESLNHALDNIFMSPARHTVKREVPIKHVLDEDYADENLFYTGDFDFVIYEMQPDGRELPILAIELDGKEHHERDVVIRRDEQKNAICQRHGFQLIRVDNTYARRYNYIKDILMTFFGVK